MKFVIAAVASLVFTSGAAIAGDLPAASWFGYVEGGYTFPTSTHTREFGPDWGPGYDDARAGSGGYGSAKVGYRINDAWDIALGFKYLGQSSGRISDDTYEWQANGGHYWNLDLEAGHRMEAARWSLRPFAGLRYQEYNADFNDHLGALYAAQETSWGIGPRIGVDVSREFGGGFSFFGSADASVLFGKARVDQRYPSLVKFSDSRTFATAGMKAGLAWEFAPGAKLGVGYQVEYLSGIGYKDFGNASYEPEGKAGQLIHGPFLRLSFNY
jgi:hypothetical protein